MQISLRQNSCSTIFRVLLAVVLASAFYSAISFGQQQAINDTLFVKSQCVVFYQCTKAEYDSLFEQMTFSLDSLVHNYEVSQERIIPFLKNTGSPYVSTTATRIVFQRNETTLYNRKPYVDLVGIILFSPNKKTEVLHSTSSAVPIFGENKKYFGSR